MEQSVFLQLFYRQLHTQKNNPYLRRMVLANIKPENISPLLKGAEINPATRDLIASAEEEVLMLFYKFDANSDAGIDILQSLITLNNKSRTSKKIRIKIMVDQRLGLAGLVTGSGDPLSWLHYENNIPFIIFKGKKIPLAYLSLETKIHGHYFFNSYHLKEIIVDRKKLMLRSGDVWQDTDYITHDAGRIENASIICEEHLAKAAAESYEEHWLPPKLLPPKFCRAPQVNFQAPWAMLMEKNPSSSPIKQYLYQSGLKIALLAAIKSSQTLIRILTPNLNDQALLKSLSAAAKRGVKVQIVLGKYHNQWTEWLPFMGGTNEQNVQKLYQKTPMRFWDFLDVGWACDEEGQLLKDFSPQAMHAKLVVVDDVLVTTGSSPLDYQGMYNSAESDCLLVSASIAKQYVEKNFQPVAAHAAHLTPQCFAFIKQSLTSAIEKLKVKTISFGTTSETEKLTFAKQNILKNMVEKLYRASSFQEIDDIFSEACQISPSNPLACHRRKNPFNFFHSPFGKTATIQKLKNIYQNLVPRNTSLMLKKMSLSTR